MITSSVVYDLTDADRENLARRLSSLSEVPVGVNVVVIVGALAPEPVAVRTLARFEKRLHINVQGTAFAAKRWHRAILDDSSEELW